MHKVIEIQEKQSAMMPTSVSESSAIISMIERAARDPAVDIAKMERLFEMHERMLAADARREFLVAFNIMQPKLPVIERNGAIKTNAKDAKGVKTGEQIEQSKYALWEDIDAAVRPIYTEHGFSLRFKMEQTPDRLTTTAVLGHKGGHVEETSIALPLDSSGSKNNVQGWGSAFSYGKRYAATAALNIVTKGQDDDGKKAGDAPTVDEDQFMQMREMIEATQTDVKIFCRYYQIGSLAEMPANRFDRAMAALDKKAKSQ